MLYTEFLHLLDATLRLTDVPFCLCNAFKQFTEYLQYVEFVLQPRHLCLHLPQAEPLFLYRGVVCKELGELSRVCCSGTFPVQFWKFCHVHNPSARPDFTGTYPPLSINPTLTTKSIYLHFVLSLIPVHPGGWQRSQHCRLESGGEPHSEDLLLDEHHQQFPG